VAGKKLAWVLASVAQRVKRARGGKYLAQWKPDF
jgi:hypothetical protein